MRQLFLDKGTFVVKNVAQPLLHENEILVSVRYSFICPDVAYKTIAHAQKNTLLNNISQKVTKVLASINYSGVDNTKDMIKEKMSSSLQTIGFSCSGKVLAIGKNITTIRPGDYVACMGAEYAHHADVICVPEQFVTRIEKKDLKNASLSGIATLALQALRRAKTQIGETIAVVGLGLVGQLIVQLAKYAGCNVIGIDAQTERLNFAKKNGADQTFHFDDENILNDIAYQTGLHGVDYMIISQDLQNKKHIDTLVNATRSKGKIIVMGNKNICLNNDILCQKEIELIPSFTFGAGQYDHNYEKNNVDYPYEYVRWTQKRNIETITNLITKNIIKTDFLISKKLIFSEAEKAFTLLEKEDVLGILLDYHSEESLAKKIKKKSMTKKDHELTFIPAKKDAIRIGIIGVGESTQKTLLPILSSIKNSSIQAFVDPQVTNALTACKKYKAAQALTDEKELFENDLVDSIIITSSHTSHAEQTLNALKQSKAVFLERPIATTFDQLKTLQEFFCKIRKRHFVLIITHLLLPIYKL